MSQTFALAIHGGAGAIRRDLMTPEAEAQYHEGLRHSLRAGHAVLAAGGSADAGRRPAFPRAPSRP